MDLTHEFTVPAGIDATWNAFNDLERIAPCFPGATLTEVDGDDFTGSVKVKLGPISLVYNGVGTFVERDVQQHRAVIEAKGKDKRGNGTAAATVTATLVPDGSGTKVTVLTDMAITGKPAQFGRGVIQDVSDKLLNQFVACISAKLSPGGAGDAETTASESAASAAAPGTAARPAPSPGPAQEPEVDPTPAGSATPGSHPTSPSGTPGSAGVDGPGARTDDTSDAAEVNMLAAVGPVLLKRYGPALAGVLAIGALLFAIIRRKRRR
ncbi:MAG: SRPBCC family protein [Propionibacteriaceae bacterium]